MGKWIRDGEEVEAKSDNRIIIGEMNEWIPPDMFEEESSMNNGCRISPFKKQNYKAISKKRYTKDDSEDFYSFEQMMTMKRKIERANMKKIGGTAHKKVVSHFK